jgi:Phasin protein
MNSQTTQTTPAAAASGTDLNPWNMLADLARQQLAVTTENTGAIFRGSEAMRKIQQDAAHQASVHHAEAAQKLRACTGQPVDLLAIQSELMRIDMQGAGQYWQQLASAALQTQIEMMTSVSRMFDDEAGGGVKSALVVFQAAIPPMANSFFVSRSNASDEQHKAS